MPLSPLLLTLRMVLTGTAMTLVTQIVADLGAPSKSAGFFSLAKYSSQIVVLAVLGGSSRSSATASANSATATASTNTATASKQSKSSASSGLSVRGYLMIIALLDVLGTMLSVWGTALLGSGLYQVVYSSQLVTTAVLSKSARARLLCALCDVTTIACTEWCWTSSNACSNGSALVRGLDIARATTRASAVVVSAGLAFGAFGKSAATSSNSVAASSFLYC